MGPNNLTKFVGNWNEHYSTFLTHPTCYEVVGVYYMFLCYVFMLCLKMKECTRELCDMIIEPRISFRLQISLYNLLAITTGLAVALILLQRNVWITKDVRSQGPDLCKGRWIFIHNVSQAYNHAFLQDCSSFKKDRDLCMYMENDGMGRAFNYTISLGGPPLAKPSWYNTWQFSLELYFHRRLLSHPCVTTQEYLADVFYVPYYGGMDLSRTISHRLPKEKLYVELVEWLKGRESWKRRNGRDHFITLGRISRDFRRPDGVLAWGNKVSAMTAARVVSLGMTVGSYLLLKWCVEIPSAAKMSPQL